jgi:DNA/RNA endonuclease YhcR with UshA esterase domain
MKIRLMLVALIAAMSLGFASFAAAQSCQDIHGLGSNGCAPSPLAGTSVTVQGVVYVVAGTYNSGSVYIQCGGGSGGMTFFESGATAAEGDLIELSGLVSAFGDEIQIGDTSNPPSWTLISSGNATSAMSIGTGALAAGTDMLGDFMRVQGVLSLVSAGFNSTYEVDDGTGPVTVFVDGTTGIDTSVMDSYLGDVVEVLGSTKCYSGAGELLPRRDSDITLKQVATDEQSWGAVKARF